MSSYKVVPIVLIAHSLLLCLTLGCFAGDGACKTETRDQSCEDGGPRQSRATRTCTDKALLDLNSAEIEVRRAGAESLVELAVEEGEAIRNNAKALAQIVLNKKEDPQVRGLVMRALAMTSERYRLDQAIVPLLTKVLLDEEDDEGVRSRIAMILPEIASPKVAAPALLKAARSKNDNVRANVAQQFARAGFDSGTLLTWGDQAIADPVAAVRMMAVVAAGKMAKQTEDKRSLALLLRALSDTDRWVQQATIDFLVGGHLGADKNVQAKLKHLLKDRNPGLAMSAAMALIERSTNPKQYLLILIGGLESKDAATRVEAARALSWAKKSKVIAAVPALEKAMNDADERVKVHAAATLIEITGARDRYMPVLREAASSKDPEVQMWAGSYLARLGN